MIHPARLFVSAELIYGPVRSSVPVSGMCFYQRASLVLTDGLNWAPQPAACGDRPEAEHTVATRTMRRGAHADGPRGGKRVSTQARGPRHSPGPHGCREFKEKWNISSLTARIQRNQTGGVRGRGARTQPWLRKHAKRCC